LATKFQALKTIKWVPKRKSTANNDPNLNKFLHISTGFFFLAEAAIWLVAFVLLLVYLVIIKNEPREFTVLDEDRIEK